MATTKQQLIELREEMYLNAAHIEKELNKLIELEVKKLSAAEQKIIKKHNSKKHIFEHQPTIFEVLERKYGRYIDVDKFRDVSVEIQNEFITYAKKEICEFHIKTTVDIDKQKYLNQVEKMNSLQLQRYLDLLIMVSTYYKDPTKVEIVCSQYVA